MAPGILFVSKDVVFCETLANKLRQWGFALSLHDEYQELNSWVVGKEFDVVFFDIRQAGEEVLPYLADLKRLRPDFEIILINKSDNIPLSMAGMQAGAADEICVPLDAAILGKKINEACRRRKRGNKKKSRSLLGIFEDSMAAATFAQSGEFDTALDLLKGAEFNQSAGKKRAEK